MRLTCMSDAVTLFWRLLTTILNPDDCGGDIGLWDRSGAIALECDIGADSYLAIELETDLPPNGRFFKIDMGLVGLVSLV